MDFNFTYDLNLHYARSWNVATGDVAEPLSVCGGGSRCWFEAGSDFRKALQEKLSAAGLLGTRIHPFLWSGANSIFERNLAAQTLAHLLVKNNKENPSAGQLIIAHSHGGNVALRALHMLPPNFPALWVVTIATPFVEILASRGRRGFLGRVCKFAATTEFW